MNRCLASLASICLGLTLGAAGCALGTAWWAQREEASLERNIGLWLACTHAAGASELCDFTWDSESYKEDGWFVATVAAQCGGVFFVIIAQILWIVLLCKKGSNTGMKVVTILFAILCGGCLVAAILIWKMKMLEDRWQIDLLEVGWSFWVNVGAAGCAGVAIILCIVSACSDSGTYV